MPLRTHRPYVVIQGRQTLGGGSNTLVVGPIDPECSAAVELPCDGVKGEVERRFLLGDAKRGGGVGPTDWPRAAGSKRSTPATPAPYFMSHGLETSACVSMVVTSQQNGPHAIECVDEDGCSRPLSILDSLSHGGFYPTPSPLSSAASNRRSCRRRRPWAN